MRRAAETESPVIVSLAPRGSADRAGVRGRSSLSLVRPRPPTFTPGPASQARTLDRLTGLGGRTIPELESKCGRSSTARRARCDDPRRPHTPRAGFDGTVESATTRRRGDGSPSPVSVWSRSQPFAGVQVPTARVLARLIKGSQTVANGRSPTWKACGSRCATSRPSLRDRRRCSSTALTPRRRWYATGPRRVLQVRARCLNR